MFGGPRCQPEETQLPPFRHQGPTSQCVPSSFQGLLLPRSEQLVLAGGPSVTASLSAQEWKITRLTFEYDSEPFGKERDAAIKKLATEAGVEVIIKISHTLYDLDK